MHYEINISKHGKHFFATHERSIPTFEELKVVVEIFQDKFPESEGYFISVTQRQNIGTVIDIKGMK